MFHLPDGWLSQQRRERRDYYQRRRAGLTAAPVNLSKQQEFARTVERHGSVEAQARCARLLMPALCGLDDAETLARFAAWVRGGGDE